VVLTIAGLIQGNAWLNGEVVYRVLPAVHIYYVVRASLGLILFVSAVIGFYNIIRSLIGRPEKVTVVEAAEVAA
jgi:cbb3-type cytochrome oxidase subunit 1